MSLKILNDFPQQVALEGEDFSGATASAGGRHGYVPAPAAGDQDKVLFGDGSFREVKSSDISYDNTTSGLPATDVQTAIDEIDAEVDDIVNVYGSKNLFPVKMTSRTLNGVTFTQNSDGSITITGTPSNPFGYPIANGDIWNNYDIGWLKNLNGKTLEISGVADDAESGVQFVIVIYDAENQQLCIWSTSVSASRTAVCNTNGADHYCAYLYVHDTTKNYNVTVYPMLRLASISDSTYEPYSMTNHQITKRLSGQSNRNLVDNPWFTINQRGQSSYTGSGYTVDRWILIDANATVTPVSGGVTITSASNSYWTIGQKFETKYTGNIFTVSVNVDGVIHSFTFTSGFDGSNQNDGTIWVWLTTEGYVYIGQAYSTTITIRAVKLEVGSVSTLAYDVAPDYAEELLKCQRYQIAIPFIIGTLISTGVADGNGSIWFPISIGTVPRINYGHFSLLSGSIRVHDDTAYTEVTSSGSVSYNATCVAQGNILGIQIGGLTPFKTYSLDSSTGGTMLFDFNL